MDMRNVDLNLLVAFDAMVEHLGVTRAGDKIGLSQPAMSAALARLRVMLGDPLFVRAGARMAPTPRALELAAPVRRLLDSVRDEILQPSGFDPATTDRSFTLITPDIGEINFLPPLLAHFSRVAPHARLRAIARPSQTAADALESGEGALAIGYFPDLRRAGFFAQKLFDNPHVCIVRRDHPAAGKKLSLKQYLAASHAVVAPDGREHAFEQFLRKKGVQRRVQLELSHFMSLLPAIEATDLIATVPRDLAHICQRYAEVRLLEVPIAAPSIAIHQYWHRRFHKDPANLWLRQAIHSLVPSWRQPKV